MKDRGLPLHDVDSCPEVTAILSEQELGNYFFQDSCDQNSMMDSKEMSFSRRLRPRPPTLEETDDSESSKDGSDDLKTLRSWRQRFSKTIKFSPVRRLKDIRFQSKHAGQDDSSVLSEKFSVTTENVSVYLPDNEEKFAHVSLPEFLFEKDKDQEDSSAVDFADIDAQDSASVVSGFLAVSFDEGCAQLEIQQNSTSGSSESEDLSLNQILNTENYLGAAYPHPASVNPTDSIDSIDYEKTASSDPRWVQPQERTDTWPQEERDEKEEVFFDVRSSTHSKTHIMDWDDTASHDSDWSFSEDDVSFSSVLGPKNPRWKYKMPRFCGALEDVPYDEGQETFSVASSFTRSYMSASL